MIGTYGVARFRSGRHACLAGSPAINEAIAVVVVPGRARKFPMAPSQVSLQEAKLPTLWLDSSRAAMGQAAGRPSRVALIARLLATKASARGSQAHLRLARAPPSLEEATRPLIQADSVSRPQGGYRGSLSLWFVRDGGHRPAPLRACLLGWRCYHDGIEARRKTCCF
jgi:hypothetical protein